MVLGIGTVAAVHDADKTGSFEFALEVASSRATVCRNLTGSSAAMPKSNSGSSIGLPEGVIQFISCHELGSARIFTLFVVRDGDDYSETQSKERLNSHMDAASGAQRPEAAV